MLSMSSGTGGTLLPAIDIPERRQRDRRKKRETDDVLSSTRRRRIVPPNVGEGRRRTVSVIGETGAVVSSGIGPPPHPGLIRRTATVRTAASGRDGMDENRRRGSSPEGSDAAAN
jgi:hypothetical protein